MLIRIVFLICLCIPCVAILVALVAEDKVHAFIVEGAEDIASGPIAASALGS